MDVRLIDNDESTLRSTLEEVCRGADRLRIAVAFAKGSGLDAAPAIEAAAASGREVRLLAGIDFQLTDLNALERISRPPSEARVYLSTREQRVFHPKVYIAEGACHSAAIIGSANLTGGGLEQNVEASLVIHAESGNPTIARIIQFHEKLWTSSLAAPVSEELKQTYQTLQDRRRSVELQLRSSGDFEKAQRDLRTAVAEAIGGYLSPGRSQCWLLVTSPENYIRCIDGSIWGDEDRERITKVRAGDIVLFYVKSPAMYLAAMGLVTRDPYESRTVIWPDDPRLYPFRFNFELLLKPSRPIPFRGLVPQLDLFDRTADPNWGQRLQASMRRLSSHDCHVLRSSLAMAQGDGLVA